MRTTPFKKNPILQLPPLFITNTSGPILPDSFPAQRVKKTRPIGRLYKTLTVRTPAFFYSYFTTPPTFFYHQHFWTNSTRYFLKIIIYNHPYFFFFLSKLTVLASERLKHFGGRRWSQSPSQLITKLIVEEPGYTKYKYKYNHSKLPPFWQNNPLPPGNSFLVIPFATYPSTIVLEKR